MIYRFGPFRFDPARRLLECEGEQTELPSKVFKCLLYLIEHRDRAVSREELLDAVWGTEHLSAGVVPQTILQIRHVLGDTGQEQHYIGTARGFGYRWVAPIELEGADPEAVADDAPIAPSTPAPAEAAAGNEFPDKRGLRRVSMVWLVVALALALGSIATVLYFLRGPSTHPATAPLASGEVALLLPVQAEAGPEDAWVRYGVMDFMIERFRTAGQPMVASETVITLVGAQSTPPNPQQLDRIADATGAKLVLAAHARRHGARWTVSLETVRDIRPPITATGEASDVIEASRQAADAMLVRLGRKAPPGQRPDPAQQRLLQQLRDAVRNRRPDTARALLRQVPPQLRRDPELRLMQAVIELMKPDPAAAGRILDGLLAETPASQNPVFRAQVLNGLAVMHRALNQTAQVEARLQEAARLLVGANQPVLAGNVSLNLGNAAGERGDYGLAEQHFARARWNYERGTHLPGLAMVDLNLGIQAMNRARPADALPSLQSAADRFAALGNPLELTAWALVQEAQLNLLDMEAANAASRRMQALSDTVDDPQSLLPFTLAQARLAAAEGRQEAAGEAFHRAAMLAEANAERSWGLEAGVIAATGQAELTLQHGDPAAACSRLRQYLRRQGESGTPLPAPTWGRSWLILVRCGLAQGQIAGARADAGALAELAAASPVFAPRLFASLAEAELAAAEGRHEAAQAAYENAETLAEAGHVPALRLLVVQSHMAWLLSGRPRGAPVPARAWTLADSVADRADAAYGAALVQLRLYHALGDAVAWRTALARAQSLAGERRIPPELQSPP